MCTLFLPCPGPCGSKTTRRSELVVPLHFLSASRCFVNKGIHLRVIFRRSTMAPPTKSTKQATRGAKQIVEENAATISFYRNMILGAAGAYLTVMSVFFEFTALTTFLTVVAGLIYAGTYQFMSYMARATYSETGQLIDSGVDLNMEGGIAEHVKDLIILTSGTQVLSLISNYFWLLLLLAPMRALWMLWKNIVAPWIFAEPPAPTEKDEKKQKKLERKMARSGYKSH